MNSQSASSLALSTLLMTTPRGRMSSGWQHSMDLNSYSRYLFLISYNCLLQMNHLTLISPNSDQHQISHPLLCHSSSGTPYVILWLH